MVEEMVEQQIYLDLQRMEVQILEEVEVVADIMEVVLVPFNLVLMEVQVS